MNHSDAVAQMAAERYLLDELGPDARDQFEEHLFDCPECAIDVRAGDVFVREARVQLPELVAQDAARAAATRVVAKPVKEKRDWLAWLRPVYLAPAFAALLGVVVYQNFVTLPGLREAANAPMIAPLTPLHGSMRGDGRQTLTTTRKLGLALPVDLLPADLETSSTNFTSFAFTLTGPDGRVAWTATVPAAGDENRQMSIGIPGRVLQNGTYKVTVAGIGQDGERTDTEHYVFDVVLGE
jgi:hypothetical protein